MGTQYLTCKFRLHNLSTHKQAVIDHALEQYTHGYQELLGYARENLGRFEQQGTYTDRAGRVKYTGMSIAKLFPRTTADIHSSAKDSLIQDVAGSLASYFELRKLDPNTSFPTCRDTSPEAVSSALDDISLSGMDLCYENECRDRLLKIMRGAVMPLYFCRADGATASRNFSLLWDRNKDRLFAALWVLPNRHPLCKPIEATGGNLIRLDTAEVFTSNSKTAILVPLEVGKNGWHLSKFLRPALAQQAAVRSAFLVRDDRRGEYFLCVTFAFDVPDAYKPVAHLGIDKGILFTAAYAVVADDGAVINLGHFDDELRALQIKHGKEREQMGRNGQKVTKRHYKLQAYEQILHTLTNDLITMAQQQQAGIVVEDLSIQVKGGRVVSRFRKLDHYLEYKCKLAGVPFRRVFAAYSSMICPVCGELMDRDDRLVTCKCGYTGHSDDTAAVNIARRALYRKADWPGGYREFHRSFKNVGSFKTE